MRATILLTTLALLLAAPAVLAQNDTGGGDVVYPDVDVDITDNDGPDESVGIGWNATTIIIVIVVALVLVVLIAALAGRDRGLPPPP